MERIEPMTDDEAYNFAETLRTDQRITALRLNAPEWKSLDDISGDIFDLENNGKPLWFHLDANGVHYIQVTFNPPLSQFSTPVQALHVSSSPLRSSDPSHLTNPLRLTSDPLQTLTQIYEDYSSPVIIFRRRVYVAKFNVHVGKSVLRRFYVIGFIDETTQ